MYMCVYPCEFQQDSCGEEERPSLMTVVKPTAKPRRARLLSKGRKLNNKKRGRPKKAAPAAEKKNKKNQSALDLLHAKTLSAAPPQGQRTHTKLRTQNMIGMCSTWKNHKLACKTETNAFFLTNTVCSLENINNLNVNIFLLCAQMHTCHLGVPFTNYLLRFSTIPLINCCSAKPLRVCNNC